MKKFKHGFTLLEMVIVMAIIAILATIIIANVLGAQTKSRDAKRKTDIKMIASALEAYRAQKGVYPLACVSTRAVAGGAGFTFYKIDKSVGDYLGCSASSGTNTIRMLISDNYLSGVPSDPRSTDERGYYYAATNDGSSYKIISYQPELLDDVGVPTECRRLAGDFAENASNSRVCKDYQVSSNSQATKDW